MCGNHASDGTPIGHHHHGTRAPKIFYPAAHPKSRRAFLGNMGKSAAVAVVTPAALAACSSNDVTVANAEAATAQAEASVTATPAPENGTGAPQPTATVRAAEPTETGTTSAPEAGTASPTDASLVWARANLGFVSAYVLARGNKAAIVDTGVAGSADAIGETLATLGLNYNDVDHVILTHNHGDHAGSISEVLAMAVNATAYAGEADLGPLPADILGLAGGEDLFGFEMLPTPGHTAGHMAVIDHQAGLLVAGDAMWTENGGVAEGPERFFADVAQSRESIKTVAALSFNTLLVGHGEPIERSADSAVAALAATL